MFVGQLMAKYKVDSDVYFKDIRDCLLNSFIMKLYNYNKNDNVMINFKKVSVSIVKTRALL